MTKREKLLLIDGHSIVFRAFYALYGQLQSMKNTNGLHTNALYGFHNMLKSLLEKEQPTHALVAFDAGRTTFRHEYFEDYKGGRESMPSELAEQMPYFTEMLEAFGVKHYELPNYEADDIIGTLSRVAEENGMDVVIVTGDKDLVQLATDHVRVDITRRGVQNLDAYTPETVEEEYGLTPLQTIDLLGLAGDPSDNIPGVTGVGEKTALKYLHEYGSIENLYEHVDELPKSKRKENLIAEQDLALLGKKLATIMLDAPVAIQLDELTYENEDLEKLIAFYKEMDFNSQLKQLDTGDYYEALEEETPDIHYEYVEEITAEMLPEKAALHLEIMGDDYHEESVLAVAWGDSEAIYVTKMDTAMASVLFKEWLANQSVAKWLYDSKEAYALLKRADVDLAGIQFDVVLASYVLTAEDSSKDFSDVVTRHGVQYVSPHEVIYGKGKSMQAPEMDELAPYVASKITAILELEPRLMDELTENDQLTLLETIEMPLALILAQMEIEGIKVDRAELEQLQKDFAKILADFEEKIYEEAGETFNINSPKQLSEILFEKMKYPPVRKTKTGYSTAQDVLEKLSHQAPIARYILDYRRVNKVQSTYVDGLLKVIDSETGLVHTRYQQTVTRTGRLSSVEPNLQNIPVRQKEGRMIRRAFISKHDDWELFAADYSQIELRILAHMSGDEHLTEAFRADEDIHTTTAMRVFDIADEEDVTPNNRRDAKAVNFGIVYGISDYGLSENLNITRKAAKQMIDTYFARFPGVQAYIDETIREAKDKKYVKTLYGRRRYLPDINARNFNLRKFAERTAMNTPIQGTAADIIKLAMIRVTQRLEEEGLQANLLLQVHDELIFEVPQSEKDQLAALVIEEMENVAELDVPLKVDGSFGKTWYEV